MITQKQVIGPKGFKFIGNSDCYGINKSGMLGKTATFQNFATKFKLAANPTNLNKCRFSRGSSKLRIKRQNVDRATRLKRLDCLSNAWLAVAHGQMHRNVVQLIR